MTIKFILQQSLFFTYCMIAGLAISTQIDNAKKEAMVKILISLPLSALSEINVRQNI